MRGSQSNAWMCVFLSSCLVDDDDDGDGLDLTWLELSKDRQTRPCVCLSVRSVCCFCLLFLFDPSSWKWLLSLSLSLSLACFLLLFVGLASFDWLIDWLFWKVKKDRLHSFFSGYRINHQARREEEEEKKKNSSFFSGGRRMKKEFGFYTTTSPARVYIERTRKPCSLLFRQSQSYFIHWCFAPLLCNNNWIPFIRANHPIKTKHLYDKFINGSCRRHAILLADTTINNQSEHTNTTNLTNRNNGLHSSIIHTCKKWRGSPHRRNLPDTKKTNRTKPNEHLPCLCVFTCIFRCFFFIINNCLSLFSFFFATATHPHARTFTTTTTYYYTLVRSFVRSFVSRSGS